MDIDTYQDHFERLIEMEQEEEMRRHEEEMKQLSGEERQRKGRCLTNMRSVSRNTGIRGEQEVKYVKSGNSDLPDVDISVGDLVQVSKNKPLHSDNPTGTVWEKTGRSLTVSLPPSLPGWATGNGVRVDLYVDNVTYRRMLDALFLLPGLSNEQTDLLNVLLERQPPRTPEPETPANWVDTDLNPHQRQAVKEALGAPEVYLIHGPPGTGKTVSITEVIVQGVKRNRTVLATADSNVAVDNLVDRLADTEVEVVRVGHPARAIPALRKHTLDYKLEENDTFQESQRRRERALELIDKRRDLTAPHGRWRRGLSDEQIHGLARQNRSKRGLSAERIREMSEYLQMSDRIDELFKECDWLEEQAVEDCLTGADVVCSTNSTAGSELLAGFRFDWVCIDEATQATEPSCLIPITKGKKLVMAGDHRQLPPTILNDEAREEGLGRSLFERMMEQGNDEINRRLRIQYRMHEDIMNFSSHRFYEGELIADSSVRNHTLGDVAGYHPESMKTPFRDVLRPRPVVLWLDTADIDAPERYREGSTSASNPVEATVVSRLAGDFVEAGLNPDRLAVITPYRDQVERIRGQISRGQFEVKTVDGFQGREKDVVLISFVRSNDRGDIGFLFEGRRLNVSLTRARRKLVLVGDTRTLSHHDLYADLVSYVDRVGQRKRVGDDLSLESPGG